MSWSDEYIGLPWCEHGRDREGLDCYGLLRLIYAEQRSIILPAYTDLYSTIEDKREIARLISGLAVEWTHTDQPEPFDAILLRIGRHESHVGVVVKAPWFIHQPENSESVVAKWTAPEWSSRVAGFFRLADQV